MEWSEMAPGTRLKVVCDIRRLTSTELARKADMSRFTLSHILGGRLPGSIGFWVDMGRILGVHLDWLLTGEGDIWQTEKAAEASSPPPLRAPTLQLTPAKAQLPQRKPKRR